MQGVMGGVSADTNPDSFGFGVMVARIALLPRAVADELYASNDLRATITEIFRRHSLARSAVALTSGLALEQYDAEGPGRADAPSRATTTVARSLVRMATRCTPAGLSASIGTVRRATRWRYPASDADLHRRAVVRVAAEVLAPAYEVAQRTLPDAVRVRANPAIRRAAGRIYVVAGPPEHATSGSAPVSVRAGAAIDAALAMCRESRSIGELVADIAAARSASVPEAREFVEQLVRHGYLLTNQYPDLLRDLTADALERLPTAELRDPVAAAARDAATLERRLRDDLASLSAADLDKRRWSIDLVHDGDDLTVGPSFEAALRRYVTLIVRNARRIEQRRLRKAFEQRYEGRTESIPFLEFAGVAMSGTPESSSDERRERVAERLVVTALAHCAREGTAEYALSEEQMESLLGTFELRSGDDFELGVQLVAAGEAALERDDFRLSTALFFGSSTAYASLGRFAYAFAGEPWVAARGDDVEIVGETSHPRLWHLANRELPVRRTVRQRPSDVPPPDELTLADLYVRMDDTGALRIVDRTGTRLPLARTHLVSFQHSSDAMRVLEYIAADGKIEPRPLFPDLDVPHVPRLIYENIVVTPACWRVARETVLDPAAFAAHRARHRIPDRISVGAADRRLQIDLRTPLGRAFLLREASRAGKTIEFREADLAPHPSGPPFASEIVIQVHPREHVSAAHFAPPSRIYGIPAVALDWTYVKLFCPVFADDDACATLIPELVRTLAGGRAVPWHFLRYSDPAHHLRVRVRGAEPGAVSDALALLRGWAERGDIERWQLDTYEPELDRYGGSSGMEHAQRVFHLDSERVVEALRVRIASDRDRAVLAAESFARLAGVPEPDAPVFATVTAKRRGDARTRASLRAVEVTTLPRVEPAAAGLGVPAEWLAQHYATLLHLHCNRFGLDREHEQEALAYLRAFAVARRARLR
jgi:hypothetical protein